MTLHYTQNYGIAYADDDTALGEFDTVTQQVASTVDAALTAGGVTPPGASDYVNLVGRVNSLESSRTTDENRLTALETTPNYWEVTLAAGAASIAAGAASGTEVQLATITVATVVGVRYTIDYDASLLGSVAGDRHTVLIRRTNATGTVLRSANYVVPAASINYSVKTACSDVATATSTTWVVTLNRSGTGSASQPATTGALLSVTRRRT